MVKARLFWTKYGRRGFKKTGEKPKELTVRQKRFLWVCDKKGIKVVK